MLTLLKYDRLKYQTLSIQSNLNCVLMCDNASVFMFALCAVVITPYGGCHRTGPRSSTPTRMAHRHNNRNNDDDTLILQCVHDEERPCLCYFTGSAMTVSCILFRLLLLLYQGCRNAVILCVIYIGGDHLILPGCVQLTCTRDNT